MRCADGRRRSAPPSTRRKGYSTRRAIVWSRGSRRFSKRSPTKSLVLCALQGENNLKAGCELSIVASIVLGIAAAAAAAAAAATAPAPADLVLLHGKIHTEDAS